MNDLEVFMNRRMERKKGSRRRIKVARPHTPPQREMAVSWAGRELEGPSEAQILCLQLLAMPPEASLGHQSVEAQQAFKFFQCTRPNAIKGFAQSHIAGTRTWDSWVPAQHSVCYSRPILNLDFLNHGYLRQNEYCWREKAAQSSCRQ